MQSSGAAVNVVRTELKSIFAITAGDNRKWNNQNYYKMKTYTSFHFLCSDSPCTPKSFSFALFPITHPRTL